MQSPPTLHLLNSHLYYSFALWPLPYNPIFAFEKYHAFDSESIIPLFCPRLNSRTLLRQPYNFLTTRTTHPCAPSCIHCPTQVPPRRTHRTANDRTSFDTPEGNSLYCSCSSPCSVPIAGRGVCAQPTLFSPLLQLSQPERDRETETRPI